ncbi:hypothetical protein FA13DRAFT_1782956, partial [Coprinellus micaceus]
MIAPYQESPGVPFVQARVISTQMGQSGETGGVEGSDQAWLDDRLETGGRSGVAVRDHDYRRGLEVLFDKLDQGVHENDEIVSFIRHRVQVEQELANSFISPPLTGKPGTGFGKDEGASLLLAFRGLQSETAAQGQIHKTIAHELDTLVADPFDSWAQGYKERVHQRRSAVLDNWIRSYEQSRSEVSKLKQQYLDKTRKADDAEDDAKFAPNSGGTGDNYTTSPRIRPLDAKRSPPHRTASVSERIAQRLKEIQKRSDSEPPKVGTPPVDKGKGRAIDSPDEVSSPIELTPTVERMAASPTSPQPVPPMLLAGLAHTPSAVSQLLSRAAAELPLRSVRFSLLGEYHEAFTGEEFVAWLNRNVQGFGGSLGPRRGRGALNTQTMPGSSSDHKAFNIEGGQSEQSPVTANDTLLKRTGGNFVNLVSKVLAQNNGTGEPPYLRLRNEADEADKSISRWRKGNSIGTALGLRSGLKRRSRFFSDGMLLQYQGTLKNLPKSLEQSLERSSNLVAGAIGRDRSGPIPPIYESLFHEEPDVFFGIDLRRWAEVATEDKKDTVPPILTALLSAIEQAYSQAPNDLEKRKSWIYEVPLPAVHHLREVLNGVEPGKVISPELSPCSTPGHRQRYQTLVPGAESAYRAGLSGDAGVTEEERLQNVGTALQKLPRVHLFVLDSLIKHLKGLIESTEVDETEEVYITKLALSLGRTILRPKAETDVSIQDRHPTLLFIDLLKNYEAILPPTIARKKRESERRMPIRKRTAPIDMRLSRNRISVDSDALALLQAQKVAQNPSLARHGPSASVSLRATVTEKLKAPPPPTSPRIPSPSAASTPSCQTPPPPPAAPVAIPAPPPPPPATAVIPPTPNKAVYES